MIGMVGEGLAQSQLLLKPLFCLWELAGRFQGAGSKPVWTVRDQRLVLPVASLRILLEHTPPHQLRGDISGSS